MLNARVCNNVDVSMIIKQIRKNKKLSQAKLGSRVKVTGKTISAYETNRIQPSLEIFLKMLNVGGYSLELKEDIYKTAKDLSIPISEEDKIN